MLRADIVVGLGFGDEGKGSWVDHLVRFHGARTVIRFNGGAQAGHQVFTSEGKEHVFAQFGSGTFVPFTDTLLSRFMLIEPEALFTEASVLEGKGIDHPLSRIMVSENAPIITPFNRLLNHLAEKFRGNARHGSCGFGIGFTQADVEELGDHALYVRDLKHDGGLSKLRDQFQRKIMQAQRYQSADTAELITQLTLMDLSSFADLYLRFYHQVRVLSESECQEIVRTENTVFEGAQGVLLDQCHGFFPHCTRSHTTFKNAFTLLDEAGFSGEISKVGLLRGYGTRHGAGPFMTEDSSLQTSRCHNHLNEWQGEFRTGWFDGVSARYALEVVEGVDVLGLTNLDRLFNQRTLKIGVGYKGIESEFFDQEQIHVIDCNYEHLTARTDALQAVSPVYQEVCGFNHEKDRELMRYLDILEGILGHPIKAFSTSSHQKSYR